MTNTTEDLTALLAKHSIAGMCGGFSDQPEAKTHACRCDRRWVTATEYIEHVAEVIAAAGWVKGREEWGVWFDSLAETYRRDTRTVWGVSEWEQV